MVLGIEPFFERTDVAKPSWTEAYKRNISGIEIDPKSYGARFRSGTPLADLVRIDS